MRPPRVRPSRRAANAAAPAVGRARFRESLRHCDTSGGVTTRAGQRRVDVASPLARRAQRAKGAHGSCFGDGGPMGSGDATGAADPVSGAGRGEQPTGQPVAPFTTRPAMPSRPSKRLKEKAIVPPAARARSGAPRGRCRRRGPTGPWLPARLCRPQDSVGALRSGALRSGWRPQVEPPEHVVRVEASPFQGVAQCSTRARIST